MREKKSNQKGAALVISILIVGFLLSIVLTLSALFIPKIRASSEIGKSSAALYAAESAIEWCLYVYRHSSVAAPVMSNSATYLNGKVNPPAPLTERSVSDGRFHHRDGPDSRGRLGRLRRQYTAKWHQHLNPC